ncbi:unnamed protein product [Pieris brassicae]|uniref:Uncharacterized protein n=1 Tax=Pieris brassicae TaxID=7116 RepID=A0A9P0XCL8_PIEBR|nr:unnamed protein product [Pieris brassicae]
MQCAGFILIVLFSHTDSQEPTRLTKDDLLSADVLINTTETIIKEDIRRIGLITYIKEHIHDCAAFEIGYLTYIIQEKYRHMVDRYNVSSYMMTRLYLMEHIMYLGELERNYWEIDHLYGMLHEIERKYKIKDGESEVKDYVEKTKAGRQKTVFDVDYDMTKISSRFPPTRRTKIKKLKRDEHKRIMDKILNLKWRTTKESTRWWWPLEYGWEIDYWWGGETETL